MTGWLHTLQFQLQHYFLRSILCQLSTPLSHGHSVPHFFWSFSFFLFFSETGSHYVDQAGLTGLPASASELWTVFTCFSVSPMDRKSLLFLQDSTLPSLRTSIYRSNFTHKDTGLLSQMSCSGLHIWCHRLPIPEPYAPCINHFTLTGPLNRPTFRIRMPDGLASDLSMTWMSWSCSSPAGRGRVTSSATSLAASSS